jgi:hypothetical protein
MEAAPVKAQKLPSAPSCVRLGKPTPKSVLAALANADHQVQEVNLARMLVTDNPARMADLVPQAQMPKKKTHCCQFHLNATAWRNPVQVAPLAPRALMDHPEIMDAQEGMVNLDHKDHLAHLAQLVPTATLALSVQQALLVP